MASRQPARTISTGYLARAVLIVLATLGMLWFSTAITWSRVAAGTNPGAALALWSVDADARAQQAAQLLVVQGGRPDITRALALAQGALQREPVNVTAARVLGLIASLGRDNARAERLMAYSEFLSRRDLGTQLWLIESNVGKNDIPGALRHYDRALRTSTDSYDLLIPVLVNAAAEPAVVDRVGDLIATRPPWWSAFAQRLVESSNNVRALRTVFWRVNVDVQNQGERELLAFALNKLVQLGDPRGAFALYVRARHLRGDGPLLRDGDFEEEQGFSMFDWTRIDQPGFGAVRQPSRDGSGNALYLVNDQARTGEVARQLLLLQPGRYRLSLRAGDVSGDAAARPSVVLRCAAVGEQMLAELRLPDADSRGQTAQGEVIVPAGGCPAQWLSINVGATPDGVSGEAWIDSLSIRRTG